MSSVDNKQMYKLFYNRLFNASFLTFSVFHYRVNNPFLSLQKALHIESVSFLIQHSPKIFKDSFKHLAVYITAGTFP